MGFGWMVESDCGWFGAGMGCRAAVCFGPGVFYLSCLLAVLVASDDGGFRMRLCCHDICGVGRALCVSSIRRFHRSVDVFTPHAIV